MSQTDKEEVAMSEFQLKLLFSRLGILAVVLGWSSAAQGVMVLSPKVAGGFDISLVLDGSEAGIEAVFTTAVPGGFAQPSPVADENATFPGAAPDPTDTRFLMPFFNNPTNSPGATIMHLAVSETTMGELTGSFGAPLGSKFTPGTYSFAQIRLPGVSDTALLDIRVLGLGNTTILDTQIALVPEPSAFAFLSLVGGLATTAFVARRRWNRDAV